MQAFCVILGDMLEFFSIAYNLVGYYVRIGLIYYIALLTIAFIPAIILSVVKVNYNRKKRLWYLAFSTCVLVAFAGFNLLAKESVGVFAIAVAICGLLNAIVFCLPTKRGEKEDAPRELIRLIDREIQGEREDEKEELPFKITKHEKVNERELEREIEQGAGKYELDFSHVKSVISRMEFFPLTASDKRQVKELENAVYCAEHGEFTKENKERINEGLGALLKIMSKYGI